MAHDDEPHGPQVGRDGETPVQLPVHLPETDDDLFGPMEPVFVEPPVPEPDPQEWPPQSGGEYADPTGQTIAPAAPAQDDAGPGTPLGGGPLMAAMCWSPGSPAARRRRRSV